MTRLPRLALAVVLAAVLAVDEQRNAKSSLGFVSLTAKATRSTYAMRFDVKNLTHDDKFAFRVRRRCLRPDEIRVR